MKRARFAQLPDCPSRQSFRPLPLLSQSSSPLTLHTSARSTRSRHPLHFQTRLTDAFQTASSSPELFPASRTISAAAGNPWSTHLSSHRSQRPHLFPALHQAVEVGPTSSSSLSFFHNTLRWRFSLSTKTPVATTKASSPSAQRPSSRSSTALAPPQSSPPSLPQTLPPCFT